MVKVVIVIVFVVFSVAAWEGKGRIAAVAMTIIEGIVIVIVVR